MFSHSGTTARYLYVVRCSEQEQVKTISTLDG